MSFSSRRRNYLLTPHRRDGLIEWMKSMLMHSFVLDALDTTGADTFSHFEMLIDEHRQLSNNSDYNDVSNNPSNNNGYLPLTSRLKQLVPTVGTFHTRLPLRRAFLAYNAKYSLTKRLHVCISFNELRHILNLAQIMALRGGKWEDEEGGRRPSIENVMQDFEKDDDDSYDQDDEEEDAKKALQSWERSPGLLKSAGDDLTGHNSSNDNITALQQLPELSLGEAQLPLSNSITWEQNQLLLNSKQPFKGPKMITFDGDQTLYSDGANFESNPRLANYLYLLLRNGVTVAVVTAAGYEYQTEKYEMRLSGLLHYFKERGLKSEDCERFYLFGGECNYLLHLGHDYKLHPVKEIGAGGWKTATKYIEDSPTNWDESEITLLLNIAEKTMKQSVQEQKIRGRVIRKKRAVGLIPSASNNDGISDRIPREALDETVLRVQSVLHENSRVHLPFCAFNGGKDVWVDVGNKRVGVNILSSYLGMPPEETLHIGDQFLNTGNDYAARDICPCVWITSPEETTYILKSILRLAGVGLEESASVFLSPRDSDSSDAVEKSGVDKKMKEINFSEVTRRQSQTQLMDVYTGEIIGKR